MDDNQQDTSADVTIEQLQSDLDQAMNGWKRTTADFENYKKQKERENKELIEFAREVTVAKLLPTLDSLELALRHMPKYPAEDFVPKFENWQKGIDGLISQLDKVLAELGVQKIEALGKKFDPHFHEAVREAESEQDDGMVVEELQSGFVLNGKVIRPSQVVISKKKADG